MRVVAELAELAEHPGAGDRAQTWLGQVDLNHDRAGANQSRPDVSPRLWDLPQRQELSRYSNFVLFLSAWASAQIHGGDARVARLEGGAPPRNTEILGRPNGDRAGGTRLSERQ